MILRHLFPVLAGLLLPLLQYGQVLEWKLYTKEDGLFANQAGNVAILENGLLWVVSENRPLRFDGRKFEEYPDLQKLITGRDRLYGLQPLEDSLLCFSTQEKLILVNPRNGEVQYYPFPPHHDPQKVLEISRAEGPNEMHLYFRNFTNSECEILRFKDRRFSRVNLPNSGIRHSSIDLLKIDHEHAFVYNSGKLVVFDHAGLEKEAIDLSDYIGNSVRFSAKQNGPGDWITALGAGYFYQFNLSERKVRPHPANRFLRDRTTYSQNFALDKAGNLWACGLDKTLLYYDAQQDTLFDFTGEFAEAIPHKCLFGEVHIDKAGVVWVSTQLGLLKVVKQAGPFDTYLTGTDAYNRAFSIRGITEADNGEIYAGTYSGIIRIDPVRKQETLTAIPHELPFHLYYQDSILWLNNGNAWDFRTDSLHIIKGANPNAQDRGAFTEDDQGRLWWVSWDRLSYRQADQLQSPWQVARLLPVLYESFCDALHYGPGSQSVWIGSENTLFQYIPRSDSLLSYSAKEFGQPVSRIMALHENEDRTLWIGTDLGLLHFDPYSLSSKRYEMSDGLPDNYVCGLLMEGDSCIWLSTNHGLSRFQIEAETFANFFEIDGLPDNEFNRGSYYKARDGRMFFGGMSGLTSFYPKTAIESYKDQAKLAQLLLTAFEKADERADTLSRSIQLGDKNTFHIYHWDRSFRFEFALTDYSDPEQIQYSYLMDGYDKFWSKTSSLNSARYNNLPPGKYTLRVRARGRKGLWHEDELAVPVIVHPPWWNTWWARGAYLLFLLAGIGRYFQWRIKSVQAQNIKLEKTVDERTRELQEQKKRAERSEKYKEQFLANMSHEIRTPMNAISGMVRILLRNRHLPEQQRFLDAIQKSSTNLLVILNDILDLSKIEAGKLEIQHIPMQIDEVLQTIAEVLGYKAEEKGLRLEWAIEPDVQNNVYGDPYRLTQILNNLVGNAIKFTDAGRVGIEVSIDQGQLMFRVIDSGIGIPKDKLNLIFEYFEQVQSTSTRAFGGTGLGLGISRRLVQRLGGTIAVESTVGVGSIFSIHLPYEVVEEQIREQQKITADELRQMGQKMAGIKLLLADDNEFNLMLAADDLNYYIPEAEITTASDGKEVIQLYEQGDYDLILMDIQMPEVDGLQATARIREKEAGPDGRSKTPIIAMTASLLKREIQQFLAAGMDDYVPKPYQLEEFIPVLYRNLKSGRV